MHERKLPTRERSRFTRVAEAIDRGIFLVAPSWGSKRLARRRHWEAVEQIDAMRHEIMNRQFEGADHDRLQNGRWLSSRLSPDSALEMDLLTLRERSQELYKNDAFAAGAIEGCVSNVINTGIIPQARIRARNGISAAQARSLNDEIQEVFWQWWCRADRTGRQCLAEQQKLWFRSKLIDGEAFVVLSDLGMADKPVPLAIEVVSADRVATPPKEGGNPLVRLGVEHDEQGRVVAYWIQKKHPYDTRDLDLRFDRITADRVLHDFDQLWPGQHRGVPWLTFVMAKLRDLKDFAEAELIAQQTAACYAAFVKTDQDPMDVARGARDANGTVEKVESLEPGTVRYLGLDQDITFSNPSRPGNTLAPYMQWQLRSVAAGLNYPFELLVKDYRELSYSGGRLSLMEGRSMFRCRQQTTIQKVLDPIWNRFVEEAAMVGAVKGLSYADYRRNPLAYQGVAWQPAGWPWIDPEKEVAASADAVDKNLSTLASELAARGFDLDETLEQRYEEKLAILQQYAKLKEIGGTLGVSDEEIAAMLLDNPPQKPAAAMAPKPPSGSKSSPKKDANNRASDELTYEPVGAAA